MRPRALLHRLRRASLLPRLVVTAPLACALACGTELASHGPRPDRSGDGGGLPTLDAGTDPIEIDAAASEHDAGPAEPALPPPAARPPAPPPDLSHVVAALAGERPDLLDASCVERGGSNEFLFEVARRLRAIDPRWGLDRSADGSIGQDVVDYHWGDGSAEGSHDVYVVDVIVSHCAIPGVHPPASSGWIDVSERGGTWTLAGLDGGTLPPPPGGDAGMPGAVLPLPDGRPVVEAVARERPDLLASSCVDRGGDNAFLFEVVRRLRASDPRWGLNWKRGVVGDLSQDVVDYYFGSGDPSEGATDVYIVDMIAGHCGDAPSPAWTDVTEATRAGGTIGRWTLAGRTDL